MFPNLVIPENNGALKKNSRFWRFLFFDVTWIELSWFWWLSISMTSYNTIKYILNYYVYYVWLIPQIFSLICLPNCFITTCSRKMYTSIRGPWMINTIAKAIHSLLRSKSKNIDDNGLSWSLKMRNYKRYSCKILNWTINHLLMLLYANQKQILKCFVMFNS